MKIYSLLVVKNEADIIRYSLVEALRWSDKIIVLDNGSTDGTWEMVQQMAAEDTRVVAFDRYEGAFNIGLRARLFDAYRQEMTWGDWWCVRLDADEIYTDDVRAVLADQPWYVTTVSKRSTDYVLAREDLDALTGDFAVDRPHYHHTTLQPRVERRFMRHLPWLVWSEAWRYPHPWGFRSNQCLTVDHYQYRSREQMMRRWQTRYEAKQSGCTTFLHENGDGWENYLWDGRTLLQTGRNLVWERDGQVTKEFRVPNLINRFIYTFLRKSKARRSYEYALRLVERTPAPVSYSEQHSFGLLSTSSYTCLRSTCPYSFRDLRRPDFPNRERHLQAIGRFAAQLHNEGIIHRDFSQGNILFDEQDHIEIIDLNRVHFDQHISLQQGLKNLERLRLVDDEAFAILTTSYIDARA